MQKGRLEQKQELKLQQRINPQYVALGRVLEMSAPEFEEEVRRELDDNPALEAVDTPDADGQNDFDESAGELQSADYAEEDDMPVHLYDSRNSSPDDLHSEVASYTADDNESLAETLMNRIQAEFHLTPVQTVIAEHIIGNIDANGYLTRPLADIADEIAIAEGIDADMSQIRTVFDAVRTLDPPGIGATDLRDCLLLQLDRRERNATVATAREITDKYFELFSKKHYDRLQAALEISREDLADAIAMILSLNPKPGAGLGLGSGAERARHVVPDFILDYDPADSTFTLKLNSGVPELAVEQSFASVPERDTSTRMRDSMDFIRRKRDEATNFIKLKQLRAETLLTIMQAIVNIQHNFFASGDRGDIRPMILKDISEMTGLDISMISRAASGKYILTPHGIYPLKMFFNERHRTDTDTSTPQILKALKEIIDSEDKHDPLSDRALADALAARGLDIARRTVAKYRERLGEPVARLRKNF